jgi:hypothetical protein
VIDKDKLSADLMDWERNCPNPSTEFALQLIYLADSDGVIESSRVKFSEQDLASALSLLKANEKSFRVIETPKQRAERPEPVDRDDPESDYIPLAVVARKLGNRSKRTIMRLIDRGLLDRDMHSRRIMISRTSYEKYLKESCS